MRKLEFRRTTDDTIYKFNLDGEYNGRPKWKREDKNIQVVFIDNVGWCVVDEEAKQVSWPSAETNHMETNIPPEGKWTSGKTPLF